MFYLFRVPSFKQKIDMKKEGKMEKENKQIEITSKRRNILLPDWTEDDIDQDLANVPSFDEKDGTDLEQTQKKSIFVENQQKTTENRPELVEVDQPVNVPEWVAIVASWTPEQTVKAFPIIDQLISEYGESIAIEYTCKKSKYFFEKDLTSNAIMDNIYLTSD
jgi:hypothetical protein